MATAETRLYGIANCDTVKKTRRWLEARQVAYEFHDYRKHGLERGLLQSLEAALGWENLLNRRGTTWRRLPEAQKDGVDRERALELMLQNPAIIKRPILAHGGKLTLGFSEARYAQIFA